MKTAILIPARIQSSRFPEKMLQPIGKDPLILHVYNKCVQSGLDTFVLTDSKRVASIIPNAIMTDDADNGTERCCQVMNKLELPNTEGVLVNGLSDGGAAYDAGIEVNDVILKVENINVNDIESLSAIYFEFMKNIFDQ